MDEKRTTKISLGRTVLLALILGLVVLLALQHIMFTKGDFYKHSLTKQEITDLFHLAYYNDADTWRTSRWFGIVTQQNPNDVWTAQEIISEVKPDYIIETGTLYGGSALLWASILEQVNPDGKVITIDIEDKSAEARKMPLARKRIEFLIGSSTDPSIVESIREKAAGKKVMVILDSLHTKAHVYSEMTSYAAMVSVGSYLIVQDTDINGHPVLKDFGPGPMEATQQFLKNNDSFAIDRSREKLLFTMHPGGYLKRIK